MPIDKNKIYNVGIVYKLHHKTKDLGNNFYVGSTINKKERERNHKKSCTDENDKDHMIYVYQFIRENGGWDDWTFSTIKEYENISIRELERFEQQSRDKLQPTLNKNKSGSEFSHIYKIDQKEFAKLKYKQYYNENHEQVLAKKNEKFSCECGGKYTSSHKALHMKTIKHQNFINNTNSEE